LSERAEILRAEWIWLSSLRIKVIDLDSAECASMLAEYINAHPDIWNEDIGEE